jgi:hypothetical protein
MLTVLLILDKMCILAWHFGTNGLIRCETGGGTVPMMPYVLLVILTALLLFNLTLQVVNLAVRRPMVVTNLRSNGPRVLGYGMMRLLKAHMVVKILGLRTAVFIHARSTFRRDLMVSLYDSFILLITDYLFILWLLIRLYHNFL